LEPRFGHDFSQVRVHTDPEADRSAQGLNALAYTWGRHIAFASGQYRPGTSSGLELIAHELAHTVQQGFADGPAPGVQAQAASEDRFERQAQTAAQALRLPGWGMPALQPGSAPLGIARKQPQVREATPEETAEFETDRANFRARQQEFFQEMGEEIRRYILEQAGFDSSAQLSTPQEALQVVQLWGLDLQHITSQLPQLTQSLQGQASGSAETASWEAQQQSLVNAMTPAGQQAFSQMMQKVRSEPFWRQYLDNTPVFIFPDLSGTNRYAGYTQTGTVSGRPGESAYIIHISKDVLEAGDVDGAATTLIHELSHGLFSPATLGEAMRPFLNQLAGLIADHPDVIALRASAGDQAEARARQVRRIYQILYEKTSYAEAEIFVHLQQLTNQPNVTIDGDSVRSSDYILAIVEGYVAQIRDIHLPPRILSGVLDALARRVAILYDRRIAAAGATTPQGRVLDANKRLALAILSMSRNDTGTR
jgi:hypothetical protein